MRHVGLAALAVLAAATVGWSAEDEPKQPESKTFLEQMEESSPLHYQLMLGKYDEVLKTLPDIEDIDAIDPVIGLTALAIASQNETPDAYDMVLALVSKYGADPNATDKNGLTPLHYAAQAGNLPVVEFLIQQGAEVDATPSIPGCGENCPQITPLYMAHLKGRTRIVEFLESRKANPIDQKIRDDLAIQAKISEALTALVKEKPPQGVDMDEWRRQTLNNAFDTALEVLRSSARMEEAAQFEALRGRMIDAIENMPPRPQGVDMVTWYRQRMQIVMANLGTANQQEKD